MNDVAFTAISYDLRGASEATGLSVSVIQDAVRTGDLIANYYGRKPVFRAVELDRWISALPTEKRVAS